MTPAHILPILERWAETITAAEEALDMLSEAVGMAPESPVQTAVDGLIGLADQWAAAVTGTSIVWLEWYRLENDMGAAGMEAGYDGNSSPIRNLEDLAGLLFGEISTSRAQDA